VQLGLPDDSGPGSTRGNRNATTLIDFHRHDDGAMPPMPEALHDYLRDGVHFP
jgi:hypothetical protein